MAIKRMFKVEKGKAVEDMAGFYSKGKRKNPFSSRGFHSKGIKIGKGRKVKDLLTGK